MYASKFCRSLTLLVGLAIAADAAPLTRDLGSNLVYYRVHTLPADLPAGAPAHPQPSVLDLRYVRADATAAAALEAWIKFHATPHTPVLVLVNAQTAAALLHALPSPSASASVIVIGAASEGFTPDIAIAISPESEQRAYDAFEHGADLATLLADNPDKVRNDEASLAHDRSTDADPEADDTPKAHPARPPVDAALQRAVHVHRALVALRKL